MGIEGIYLNITKTTYNKPTINIILKGEKLKAFPPRPPDATLANLTEYRSGECSHSHQRRKRKKRNPNRKEKVKLSVFADTQKILKTQPENYKSSSTNLVKLQDTKSTHRNLLHSHTVTTKDQKNILLECNCFIMLC